MNSHNRNTRRYVFGGLLVALLAVGEPAAVWAASRPGRGGARSAVHGGSSGARMAGLSGSGGMRGMFEGAGSMPLRSVSSTIRSSNSGPGSMNSGRDALPLRGGGLEAEHGLFRLNRELLGADRGVFIAGVGALAAPRLFEHDPMSGIASAGLSPAMAMSAFTPMNSGSGGRTRSSLAASGVAASPFVATVTTPSAFASARAVTPVFATPGSSPVVLQPVTTVSPVPGVTFVPLPGVSGVPLAGVTSAQNPGVTAPAIVQVSAQPVGTLTSPTVILSTAPNFVGPTVQAVGPTVTFSTAPTFVPPTPVSVAPTVTIADVPRADSVAAGSTVAPPIFTGSPTILSSPSVPSTPAATTSAVVALTTPTVGAATPPTFVGSGISIPPGVVIPTPPLSAPGTLVPGPTPVIGVVPPPVGFVPSIPGSASATLDIVVNLMAAGH